MEKQNGKMARLMSRMKSCSGSICVEIQSHGQAERLQKATPYKVGIGAST